MNRKQRRAHSSLYKNAINHFEKNGCSLGTEGSVSYQFEICGLIKIKKESCSEDEIFEQSTNFGAEDFKVEGEFYEIYTKKNNLHEIQSELEKKYQLNFCGIIYNPKSSIKVEKQDFEKIISFIDALEDDDDVQKVYSNFEVDEKILTEMSS